MNVYIIEIIISNSNTLSHLMRKCFDFEFELSHECLHDWNRNFKLEYFVSLDCKKSSHHLFSSENQDSNFKLKIKFCFLF
jgi:hypothetical protein